MLKCGACETVITPKLGMPIPGYFEVRPAQDMLDDLYAKAVVFDNGKKICGFLVVDMLHITANLCNQIREKFRNTLMIDADGIMISATHSHTSFAVEYNDEFSSVDEQWLAVMVTKAADALIMAYRRRVPCRFGFARTEEHDLAFNRRYFMKDGSCKTWPGIGNPDAIRPAGPVDPEVGVIRVDSLDGRPIAVITNFANHLDLIGGCKYSADYPGVLSKELKKRLDCDSVVSVFLNGCCGDVTHIDYTGEHTFDDKHYIKSGKILADDVMSVYGGIEMTSDAKIDYIFDTKKIARRQVSEDDYLEYKEALLRYERDKKAAAAKKADDDDGEYEKPSTGNADSMAMSYVKCNVALFEHPLPHELVYLQGIRLGDIYFAGMPGEMFAELGLELKARSPFEKTVCVELANGCFGYIATKKAFSEGGYEVSLDRYVNMSEDTGDIINDVLIDIAEKLK